ncbi:hypothetical protein [Clostridium akagii]|uniref:hypothetical protein n=1 Tax=Clostridium akagii TaxID=91623 RepID=UPI00047A0799|nr:hypothetical protein [Clostridium akagii]
MTEKKSFYEIITKNLEGRWCNGLAILNISDDEIRIDNIYNNNEKTININDYPMPIKEKVFSKVIEMDYEAAIREFNANNKRIISPKVLTDEIITFDGFKHIEYGGNVYCHIKDNRIIVNDKDDFDNFDEILEIGLSEEKAKGKWLVF